LSKVLETVAKKDLEAFMKAKDILPMLQHGFRKGRSCTTALATAHAAWVSTKAKGKVVAVVGFDLSAAFNTVGREDLLPKMLAMGIGGKALRWFRCYLTDAKQRVVWDGQVSDMVDVEYGVWQGSLLGPVLYLLHISDLPLILEIRETNRDSGYPDDKAVWVVAEDLKETHRELQRLVNVIVNYTKVNGLALNEAKTQVRVGGKAKAKDMDAFTINVDGAEVKPSNAFDLLGIMFDWSFTVRPYLHSLAREARFRAVQRCKTRSTSPPWPTTTAAWEWFVDGQGGTLPPCHGEAKTAQVDGHNPGDVGTSPSLREQRGTLRCWLQEGGPRRHQDLLEAAKYLSLN
jgi:hypothetical protein